MIVYTIDGFMIYRNHKRLKNVAINLPVDGEDYKKRIS